MLNARTLSSAGVTGVLAAALVAALVLGRGELADPVTIADLDRGGVLVVRTEVYDRHGANAEQIARLVGEGEIGLYPERRLEEGRALIGPRGRLAESRTVTWTEAGAMLELVTLSADGALTERPAFGVREFGEISGLQDQSLGVPSEWPAAMRALLESRVRTGGWRRADLDDGSVRMTMTRPVAPGELLAPDGPGYLVPYFGDLAAVEVVREETYSAEYLPLETEWSVILADGSRVLVHSASYEFTVLPSASWGSFIAGFWAD